MKWTSEAKEYLVQHKDDSYEELSAHFGVSVRAVKHAVSSLGLKRSERRRWEQAELDVLNAYPELTPREFIEKGLVNRSEFQVAKVLRDLRGTARRQLAGAGGVSAEFAYLLGAICSDGCVTKTGLTMVQRVEDVEFLDEVERCVRTVWGLPVKRDLVKRSCVWGGEKKVGEYAYLGVYSVDILRTLGTEEGVSCGNVRGPRGEWVEFIDAKYSWVWQDPYIWSFLGGLFDGDGHADDAKVDFGVKPVASSIRLIEELSRVGVQASKYGDSVFVNGGAEGRQSFVRRLNSVLLRKKKSSGLVEFKEDGVWKLSRNVAEGFFANHHYTGSLPGGVQTYGWVKNGKVVACSAFGKGNDLKGVVAVASELKRFAADGTVISSEALGACIRAYVRDNPRVELIITFADKSQGHEGIIYKATNAVYVGYTGETIRVVASDGRSYGGRYLAQTLLYNKVDVASAKVEIVAGKHKYVYVVAKGSRGEVLRSEVGKLSSLFK